MQGGRAGEPCSKAMMDPEPERWSRALPAVSAGVVRSGVVRVFKGIGIGGV